MNPLATEKFIVRADYYGNVVSNKKLQFWFPRNKGNIIIDHDVLTYVTFGSQETSFAIPFKNIIKVKMETLRPVKNRWISGIAGSPYYLLFWIPFWNRHILNLTILDEKGFPWEHFFRLKTRRITAETFDIIKNAITR